MKTIYKVLGNDGRHNSTTNAKICYQSDLNGVMLENVGNILKIHQHCAYYLDSVRAVNKFITLYTIPLQEDKHLTVAAQRDNEIDIDTLNNVLSHFKTYLSRFHLKLTDQENDYQVNIIKKQYRNVIKEIKRDTKIEKITRRIAKEFQH
jgi:type III secretory pathway component EscV